MHNLICNERKVVSNGIEDVDDSSSDMDPIEAFNEKPELNVGQPQQVRYIFKDYLNGVVAVPYKSRPYK